MTYNQGLNNTSDFVNSFIQQSYPQDSVVVSHTTSSRSSNPMATKTYTTRTFSEALSGDLVNRNSRLSLNNWTRFASSDLRSMLIGGSEIGYSTTVSDEGVSSALEIVDPNSTNTAEIRRLTGGAAFNQMLTRTIAARNLGADIASSAIEAINAAYEKGLSDAVSVNGMPHDAGAFTYRNIELVGAAPRPSTSGVAIADLMDDDEKQWLLNRANKLKGYGSVRDESVLTNGFQFDLPDSLKGLYQTGGYADPDSNRALSESILESVVQLEGYKTAYLAPALIELLLYLGSNESEVSIRCETGAGGVVTSGESGMDISSFQDNDYVNDHILGRAVDIISVADSDGTNKTDLYNNGYGVSVALYRPAFEKLMEELNKVGQIHPYLLPDSIGVHEGLKAELEIVDEEFEPSNSSLRVKYPGLKYVDFYASSSAKAYIHLSFGANRCGMYSGDGVLAMGTLEGKETSVDLSSGVDSAIIIQDGQELGLVSMYGNSAITQPYIGDMRNASLTITDLFAALRLVATDEAAAILCAIAARESGENTKPGAFNPSCRLTEDFPLPTPSTASGYTPFANGGYDEAGNPLVAGQDITTTQAFYNQVKKAVDFWSGYNNAEGYNAGYDNSRGGHPLLEEMASYPTDLSDFTTDHKFDCSGLVHWAATKVGLHIDYLAGKVERVSDAVQLTDWGYTGDIIAIMNKFGTKFLTENGDPDYERAWNTPGAIMVRDPKFDPDRGGHVVICKGTGKDRGGGNHGTILHAAGNEYGVIEGGLMSYADYHYVGVLPGMTISSSAPEPPSTSTSTYVDYDVSDLRGKLKGDWSVGLFQINLLPTAHGSKTFLLPSGSSSGSSLVEGWKLGLRNYAAYGINSAAPAGVKMASLYKPYKMGISGNASVELASEVDERVWVPLNQVYMLYTVITSGVPPEILGEEQKLGYNGDFIFEPWGDYDGGPYYGFISNVKFSIAENLYTLNTSKTSENLKQWIRTMFEGPASNAKAARSDRALNGRKAYEYWLDGSKLSSPYNTNTSSYTDGGIQSW